MPLRMCAPWRPLRGAGGRRQGGGSFGDTARRAANAETRGHRNSPLIGRFARLGHTRWEWEIPLAQAGRRRPLERA